MAAPATLIARSRATGAGWAPQQLLFSSEIAQLPGFCLDRQLWKECWADATHCERTCAATPCWRWLLALFLGLP